MKLGMQKKLSKEQFVSDLKHITRSKIIEVIAIEDYGFDQNNPCKVNCQIRMGWLYWNGGRGGPKW